MNNKDGFTTSPERRLILLGQIGNMRARLKSLRRVLELNDHVGYFPLITEIEAELAYLELYLPSPDDELPF